MSTSKENINKAPTGKSHNPVLTVDYQHVDLEAGYGDAHFLDVGQSTWNKEEFSAKVWRWADKGQRWSRQGEELPLSRVLDLATLVAAAAMGKHSTLGEIVQNKEQEDALESFFADNMRLLGPKLDALRKVLQPSVPTREAKGAPNLFDFATSELSQDAMFTWLLSWAKPECGQYDKSLHEVARMFVALLTGKTDLEIKKITAGRQWAHIDIWAEINDDAILIIEDKTGTTIHDDQLQRYKETVEREYPNRVKYYAYVKTGNEPRSMLQNVAKAGYRIVLRKDIIDCLAKYKGDNVLLCNYRDHLTRQEAETQSFKSLPEDKWTWLAWEGFYKELDERIGLGSWSYVSNPSGGFLGAWWHFNSFGQGKNEVQMYLQFEQGNLCFKISPFCEKADRSTVRDKCYGLLMSKAQGRFAEIVKPARFGAGEYMTIATVSPDAVFGKGKVDIDGVIKRLRKYESLIDECCNQ